MSAEGRMARDVADAQVRMFAMFVGRGLFVTRAALEAASGIPESSLREYAKGAAIPLHVVMTLARFLPRAAINMLTEPGDVRLVDAGIAEASWDGIAASAAGLTATICNARSDGHIDHQERLALRRQCGELIAELDGAMRE